MLKRMKWYLFILFLFSFIETIHTKDLSPTLNTTTETSLSMDMITFTGTLIPLVLIHFIIKTIFEDHPMQFIILLKWDFVSEIFLVRKYKHLIDPIILGFTLLLYGFRENKILYTSVGLTNIQNSIASHLLPFFHAFLVPGIDKIASMIPVPVVELVVIFFFISDK